MKKPFYYCCFKSDASPFYGLRAFFIIPMLITSTGICIFIFTLIEANLSQALASSIYWFLAAVAFTAVHFYLYYNSLSQKINFIITQNGILDASLLGAAFFIPWSRIDKIDKIKSSTDYLEYVDIIFHLKDKATSLSTAVELNKIDDRFFGKKYTLHKKLVFSSSSSRAELLYQTITRIYKTNNSSDRQNLEIKKLGNINIWKYISRTIITKTLLWNIISAIVCICLHQVGLFI
ncbi:MAG: hypothetical protein R3Y32_05155 [Bacillota bacterium]